MRRDCICCGKIYGECPPYEDKNFTTGYCAQCLFIELVVSMLKTWVRKEPRIMHDDEKYKITSEIYI
jgi:hypothetical protein